MDNRAKCIVANVREGTTDPFLIAAWIVMSADVNALIQALPRALIDEDEDLINEVQDAIVESPELQGLAADLHGKVKILRENREDEHIAKRTRVSY
jgi:hypothetical protein